MDIRGDISTSGFQTCNVVFHLITDLLRSTKWERALSITETYYAIRIVGANGRTSYIGLIWVYSPLGDCRETTLTVNDLTIIMSEVKTKPTKVKVEDFLNAIEHPTRKKDGFELLQIMKEITKKKAKMWGPSIVGFGIYHYKYKTGREGDMPLVGFSPRKQSLSVYIMPGFEEYMDILGRLGKHKIGKSCLYINKLADVDISVLKELIEKSIEHTVTKGYRTS